MNIRVCLVAFGDPAYCPVVMSQVKLLNKAGFDVDIFCLRSDKWEKLDVDDKNNRTIYVDVIKDSKVAKHIFLKFILYVMKAQIGRHYKIILVYDLLGFYIASLVRKLFHDIVIFYHQNEVEEIDKGGVLSKIIKRQGLKHIKMAGIISFPDKNRANYFFQQTELMSQPIIIGNFPLRLKVEREQLFDKLFKNKGDNRYILYQGSVGSGHGLESTVISLTKLPFVYVLVLIGRVADFYKDQLLSLAKYHGVEDRVKILGRIEGQTNLISHTASAHVGLALQEPINLNMTYTATASQKIFEYMQAGLPIVASNLPGYKEIIEDQGVGFCVDPLDPDAIAGAISKILSALELHRKMSDKARELHLTKYNYEEAFQPAIDTIRKLLA